VSNAQSNTQIGTHSQGTRFIAQTPTEVDSKEVEVVEKKKRKKKKKELNSPAEEVDNDQIISVENNGAVPAKKAKTDSETNEKNPEHENVAQVKPKKKKKKKKNAAAPEANMAGESIVKMEKSNRKEFEAIETETGCTIFDYQIKKLVVLIHEEEQTALTKFAYSIVHRSASQSQVKVDWILNQNKTEDTWETTLTLDGIAICKASSKENVPKKRKDAAVNAALRALLMTQHRMIVKDSNITSLKEYLLINHDGTFGVQQQPGPLVTVSTVTSKDANANQLPDSNIGLRMMKGMGWTGGGLGAQQQGIVKPITADIVIGRSGLGFDGTAEGFRDSVRLYLRNYIASQSFGELIFSSEFSIEQRKTIHGIARSLGLFSKSSGGGTERHLVVHRSTPKYRPLLHFVQQLSNSASSDPLLEKFRIIAPGC